jgi:hypothetical protein
MFGFLKKILGLPTAEEKVAAAKVAPVSKAAEAKDEKPRRAKDGRGKFVADDPSTPENEAWVGGQAPAKKAKKPAAKKLAAKKTKK